MSEHKLKLPLTTDGEGIYIFDGEQSAPKDTQMAFEIRGWGHLQYRGEKEARKIQKARAEFAVKAMNEYADLRAQLATAEEHSRLLIKVTESHLIEVLKGNVPEWLGEEPNITLMIDDLRKAVVSRNQKLTDLRTQLAAIRPAFEKLLEYAKKEEKEWGKVQPNDDRYGWDTLQKLRREALALAEHLEVKE